jgi:hypothetical protein
MGTYNVFSHENVRLSLAYCGCHSKFRSIFADCPEIWNSWQNTWVHANFKWDDSDGEMDSEVERIYCAAKFDPTWRTGFPIKGLEDRSWLL